MMGYLFGTGSYYDWLDLVRYSPLRLSQNKLYKYLRGVKRESKKIESALWKNWVSWIVKGTPELRGREQKQTELCPTQGLRSHIAILWVRAFVQI